MSPRRPALALILFALVGATSVAAATDPDPIAAIVHAPTRDPAAVERDGARRPEAVLRFLGVGPRSRVVELWPAGGYWTEMLAPLTAAHGSYLAALGRKGGSEVEEGYAAPPPALAPAPAARAPGFASARLGTLAHGHTDLGAAGSADVVLTFRNLHNWVANGTAPEMLAAIHRVLRPGGTLGIEDHRARPDRPQDPKAADGYLRQDYAVRLVEQAGFKLVAASELLANPRDTTHWPKGVWTLPPTYALGDQDRAKYRAVGEADNFLLKFRRVG